MESEYDALFAGWSDRAAESANVVVPIILDLFCPQSVVDVGCGTGTWLAAFANNGIDDYLGIDGDYMLLRADLRIPRDRFLPADLEQGFEVGRRFDVAVSLEVAEHLLSDTAPGLVAALVDLAPVVIFSAAIPGQPGFHHVHLQWPAYWADLFGEHGYVAVDLIRQRIWLDERVEWWYRQNILVFVDGEHFARLDMPEADLRPVVHPAMHEELIRVSRPHTIGLREIAHSFLPAIRDAARARWPIRSGS